MGQEDGADDYAVLPCHSSLLRHVNTSQELGKLKLISLLNKRAATSR